MHYTVHFSHINPDFSVEQRPEAPWSMEAESDEDMIFLMNRVAVTTSQCKVLDFPEMEITVRNKRVTVTSIEGLLYYSDPSSANRRNLKVVPEEVIRLLADVPLEEVFRDASDSEEVRSVPYCRKSNGKRVFRLVVFCVMGAALGFLGRVVWKELIEKPSLLRIGHFIPSIEGNEKILEECSAVYVNEYAEGGLAFQLTENGQADFYEIWYSQERQHYVLVPTESLKVQVGTHAGETALLAGQIHLMLPRQDRESIYLHDLLYRRHHGLLQDLGEVLQTD